MGFSWKLIIYSMVLFFCVYMYYISEMFTALRVLKYEVSVINIEDKLWSTSIINEGALRSCFHIYLIYSVGLCMVVLSHYNLGQQMRIKFKSMYFIRKLCNLGRFVPAWNDFLFTHSYAKYWWNHELSAKQNIGFKSIGSATF